MAKFKEVRIPDVHDRKLRPQDFHIVEIELHDPAPGEVQIQNLWMSVDPYMKECLIPGSRLIPDTVKFSPGQPLPAAAIGRVIQSRSPDFEIGDLVQTNQGWRERFNAQPAQLQKIAAQGVPPQAFLGPLGQTGLTAFVGTRFADIKPGETVLVSAAAGAVGSIACQIAKMKSARVIGTARSADKLAFLENIGVDIAIDYRAEPDFHAALKRAAPEGIDVYYDNVGGMQLATAVECARPFGRIILCGVIANEGSDGPKPNLKLAIPLHLQFQGFSTRYYLHEMSSFRTQMIEWIKAGHIHWRETVEVGIELAATALFRMLNGENIGKMLVKLD